jgi:nucleoside-diphosphate-sugar epimerase
LALAGRRDIVILTGCGGFIGGAAAQRLSQQFDIIGFDLKTADDPALAASFAVDLSDDASVAGALEEVKASFGDRIASVIHLAAYFDLSGEPDPKYRTITVEGTGRLLSGLKAFEPEQFVFVSTMLVHAAGRPGEIIDEETPLERKFPYRDSKIDTEALIHEERGRIPVVYLRPAGVYDDACSNTFLARQIARIHQRSAQSYVYPGDPSTGQSFLHVDDLVEAFVRLVERRKDLPEEVAILVGEPEAIGYGELQNEIARPLFGTDWPTWEIPKAVAKAGSYVEAEVLDEDPFIRPWMVDIADDHYAVDISRARRLLGWEPKHRLRDTLPKMIETLKRDPVAWYRANKLDVAIAAGEEALQDYIETPPPSEPQKKEHMAEMAEMHRHTLWAHFMVVALGAWLLTSPFQFGLFDPEIAGLTARDVTAERNLWEPALRNAFTGWSNIVSGLLLMLFGTLSLSQRHAWAQWGTTAVGLWLLFAGLFFWTPSAAAYANDTIVGAMAIAFSVLVPMMPGMSHEGMMDPDAVPPGWTYSPSSWLQRLPIIALGLFGFFIARYLAAYQLGHVNAVWDPIFDGALARNGSEHIITSDVSKAWPIADAGLGASAYMIEALMGAMGSGTRWRTMPWMVMFFFILVVPLGGVSIFFILIQPVIIGTYCTLCLIAAFAMLVMIPLALDEVIAMGQYMVRSLKAGEPFLRTFLMGGRDPAAEPDERPGFEAPLKTQIAAATWGVTVPWTLAAAAGLGAWLMFTPLVFGTADTMADSDHMVGGLVVTVAIIAMAEVARPVRFVNVLFGLWLIAAPWLLSGVPSALATAHSVAVGIALIALSLPRGRRSEEHYGGWERFVV